MTSVSRLRPRFTLSALFLVVAALSVLFAWQARIREEARRIRGLHERQRYAIRVLTQAAAHPAFMENELLRKHRLYLSGSGEHREPSEPGRVRFELEAYVDSHGQRRSAWPEREIKKAVLSALVEVVKDMDVLSSVDITTVSPDCAIVAGDEGWIVWEFVEPLPHSLQLKCKGMLTYDEPLAEQRDLFQLGEEPELALRSSKSRDRLAGAAHVRIQQNRAHAEAVLSAIDRETDPAVLSRLFQALELEQPAQNGADTLVLARLRRILDRDGPHALLAARTILSGDQLFRLFNSQRPQWSAAALLHLRRASIDLLKSGKSKHSTNAVQELRRQMGDGDTDAVDAMIAAIQSGRTSQQTQVELYQALRGNAHAVDPLFVLLRESDRPEVWYPAAEFLQASATFIDSNGEKVWDRILRLSGKPKHRMQVVGSYSAGHKEELDTLGEVAFSFLVPLLEYRIWENCPSLYSRAADMLAKLGDKRAVPLLVRAVDDHFQHGNLDESHTAYGAAQLVKAINELTGENFGGLGLGPATSGDEVERSDWTKIRQALAAYFDKPHVER